MISSKSRTDLKTSGNRLKAEGLCCYWTSVRGATDAWRGIDAHLDVCCALQYIYRKSVHTYLKKKKPGVCSCSDPAQGAANKWTNKQLGFELDTHLKNI